MNDIIVLSRDVQAAFDAGAPVVALESTIITHGMPYPQNLQTHGARGRGPYPRGRRRARHHRRDRRPPACGPRRGRHHRARPGERCDEALARRFCLCAGRRPNRRDHGRRHNDGGPPRRHFGLCHRRHRRRAPGRCGKFRYLRRSRRARPHPGHRRLRRRQGHSRHPQDARGVRDPGRAGGGFRPGRHARLLVARVRPESPARSIRRRPSPVSRPPAGRWATMAAC